MPPPCCCCGAAAPLPPARAGTWQRVGESTELALRVFAEKVGLPVDVAAAGGGGMGGGASSSSSGRSKDLKCNAHWQVR